METKGRPKVASLQESTNACMQWAVVGPPGDEKRETGEEKRCWWRGRNDGADGCSTLTHTIPQGAHSLPDCVFVDSVSVP